MVRLVFLSLLLSIFSITLAAEEKVEKVASPQKPYSVSMTLDSVLGQGIFVYDEYARDPYFAQTLVIAPSYKWNEIRFGASISASTEHTNANNVTYNHQVFISDLNLSASKALYVFKSAGISLNGNFGINLPLSLASQRATLLFGSKLGLSLSKGWGKFSLSYSLGLKKNFHQYQSPVIRKDDLTDFETYSRVENGGLIGEDLIATGGNNVSYGISNSIAAGYGISDKLSLSFSLAYSLAFKYQTFEKDDETGEYATGNSYRDVLIGGLGLGYQLTDTFSLAAGMNTAQMPKTADQKGFNFPWFNFSRPADNITVFYFDISANF